MEIGPAAAGVGVVELSAAFNVEPDGRLVLLEHAGVHREGQPLTFRLQSAGERGQEAVGPIIRPFPEEANVVVARVEGADGEIGAVEGLWRAGRDGAPSARVQGEANERNQNDGRSAPRRLFCFRLAVLH